TANTQTISSVERIQSPGEAGRNQTVGGPPPEKETTMSNGIVQRGASRREFLSSALAFAGMTAAAHVGEPWSVGAAVPRPPPPPRQPDHPFGPPYLPRGHQARNGVGDQTHRRAGTAGDRAVRKQHRKIPPQPDAA